MSEVLIHIPQELFSPAEFKHFEGTYAPEVIKFGPDLYTLNTPIEWQVDVTNTGDALLVTGTAEVGVRTSCARCLENADYELFGEIDGYFLLQEEEGEAGDREGDEFDVLPESNDIDLEPLIMCGLLLDMPLLPLCDDDCKGLCPKCGENLNNGPCECGPEDEQPEEDVVDDSNNPFAVLKGYNFGDSAQ